MAYTRNEFLTNLLRADGGSMYNYDVAKDMDPNMVVDEFSAPSMPVRSSRNMARIEEINKRLEEIQKEKERLQNGGLEEAMGKYKYLYEADPSVYMNYKQNLRNDKQTEQIRKATEDATKASNAQTAWKQLLIDEEAEKYNLAAIQNKAQQALESGNKAEYIAAKNDEARAVAKLSRLAKDKDMYKKQFSKQLGLLDREEDEVEAQYDSATDANVAQLGNLEQLVADIQTASDDLRTRPAPIEKKAKTAYIDEANKKLADFRNRAGDLKLSLSPQKKAELDKDINAFEDSIPTFKKNQGTKLTKDEFAKLSGPQLIRLGKRALLQYKNQGWTNPFLDRAIAGAK